VLPKNKIKIKTVEISGYWGNNIDRSRNKYSFFCFASSDLFVDIAF
jgi:hypothetical protein